MFSTETLFGQCLISPSVNPPGCSSDLNPFSHLHPQTSIDDISENLISFLYYNISQMMASNQHSSSILWLFFSEELFSDIFSLISMKFPFSVTIRISRASRRKLNTTADDTAGQTTTTKTTKWLSKNCNLFFCDKDFTWRLMENDWTNWLTKQTTPFYFTWAELS